MARSAWTLNSAKHMIAESAGIHKRPRVHSLLADALQNYGLRLDNFIFRLNNFFLPFNRLGLHVRTVLDVKKAMKDAGCPHVKVRCFSHPRFDGFINKGIRSFGMRSDIRIAGRPPLSQAASIAG